MCLKPEGPLNLCSIEINYLEPARLQICPVGIRKVMQLRRDQRQSHHELKRQRKGGRQQAPLAQVDQARGVANNDLNRQAPAPA